MKKRLPFLLAAVMGVSVLASGCNLFAMDKNAYYNQTIATVTVNASTSNPTTLTINKEELMQGVNRYGATLQNNGYSGQAMLDYIVDLLVDQKIVINEVSELIKAGKIVLDNKDVNELYTSTYENMEALLSDYTSDVANDWDIESAGEPEADSSSQTEYVKFEAPSKMVKVNEGTDAEPEYVWKIELIEDDTNREETLICAQDDIVDTVTEKLNDYVSANPVRVEAKKRYIYDLKNYQAGRGMTTVDAEVWKNEIDRVYKSVLDTKYLTLYTEYLEKDTEGASYSVIGADDVFGFLEKKIAANYTAYTTSATKFDTDMLQNRSSVYYMPSNSEAGEYFYVSHILVKFEDGQFDELDKLLQDGTIDQETYNSAREVSKNSTKVKSYGEVTESYTVEAFYSDFAAAMFDAKTTQAKMDVFNEFMYEFNEDTGNKNQDYDYVIGTKSSGMVEPFTNAARELYDNGNGQVGDISGMVESEYGIHILMYLGPVENLFEVSNIDTFSLTTATGEDMDKYVEKITTTKLSNLNTKTVFDYVYEQLSSSTVSILENLSLNTLKSDVKIVTYPKHYSDLY